ncbi:MAG: ExbD/TolR family protein [Pseudorhodobacter sp.]
MKRRLPRRKPEPTIALINIVFLMLIFFLVAGTLARPVDRDLNLVRVADLDQAPPPDALVLHADGQISHEGRIIEDLAGYLSGENTVDGKAIRLLPDRDAPAEALITLGATLRESGAERVLIVTERGLE